MNGQKVALIESLQTKNNSFIEIIFHRIFQYVVAA